MSTVELKEQLISKIQITDDIEILEGLLRLLEFESKDTNVYELNDAQNSAIDIAREQIIKGEYYTEEEANKLTEEWLKK